MNLGFWEIVAIAGVALLFFGPARLPGLGKSLGESIRGFKKGLDGLNEELNDDKKPQAKNEELKSSAERDFTSTSAQKDKSKTEV